jgi:hypothetical protein
MGGLAKVLILRGFCVHRWYFSKAILAATNALPFLRASSAPMWWELEQGRTAITRSKWGRGVDGERLRVAPDVTHDSAATIGKGESRLKRTNMRLGARPPSC